MKRRRLRKIFLIPIYVILLSTVVYSTYKMWDITKLSKPSISSKYQYSTTPVVENVTPTINEVKAINKPYSASDVSISIPYYDITASAENQQNALIYYENIYMQNTGVMYSSQNTFDVLSVLDGTIKDVKDDPIMGKVVQVEHNNNLLTTYQCLGEIKVAKGDTITANTVLGTSGPSKLNESYSNNLHFEVFYKGNLINPELFYSMNLNDLQ